jgi:uncharacterized protein (DUF2336 family)
VRGNDRIDNPSDPHPNPLPKRERERAAFAHDAVAYFSGNANASPAGGSIWNTLRLIATST